MIKLLCFILFIWQIHISHGWCRGSEDCKEDECCVHHEKGLEHMLEQIKVSLGHNRKRRSIFEEAAEWVEGDIKLGYCQKYLRSDDSCDMEPQFVRGDMYRDRCPCDFELNCISGNCLSA